MALNIPPNEIISADESAGHETAAGGNRPAAGGRAAAGGGNRPAAGGRAAAGGHATARAGQTPPPRPPEAAEAAAPEAASASSPAPDGDRQTLTNELLRELTAWPRHLRPGAFKSWHRGALSLVHLNVVAVLDAEGPLPMRRLAEALDVSDASATGIVDRMERRGLLERRHDVDDRRVVLVELTGQGSQVFEAIEGERHARLSRLLGELSADELAGFLNGLRAMHAARSRIFGPVPGLDPAEESSGSVRPVATTRDPAVS